MERKPGVLLHVCCGPCATAVIERLSGSFDVTCYWYNPNVEPPDEHARRLEAARQVAQVSGCPFVEGAYDNRLWYEAVRGLEAEPEGGRRCAVCFAMRLGEAARYAGEHGFERLACTMSISPHKSAKVINEVGGRIAAQHGVEFVAEDFESANGFQRSVELSKLIGIYRQKYCGCLFARDRAAHRAHP